MKKIIDKLEKYNSNNNITELKNNKLNTKIICYSDLCKDKILEFSNVFNNLFKNNSSDNKIVAKIIQDNDLFSMASSYLNEEDLIETKVIKDFNLATITTSLAKCTKDKNFYILRCYEYFIYIFDKNNKNCYMIIKNNKKAITMVNILLLTPYLMYGELYAIHGGLVSNGKENILINNSSLGGKTTFALLFALNNWDIITEETTYITKDGIIFPYNIRNYFNIRVGTYLTFKDYFIKKGIINEQFLKMEGQSNQELFAYGKENQFSIDFDKIGKIIELKKMKITHSLKVSIENRNNIDITKCSSLENVKSFLELSLAPTVLLFKELFDYYQIDKNNRFNELTNIFINTQSFILKSNFDYKNNYKFIINKINIK